MDATAIGLGVLSSVTALACAGISTRANTNARKAHKIGADNARTLERIEVHQDRRQTRLIKQAVEAVAREHPQLLSEAVGNEVVRTVLEAILEGHMSSDELHQRRTNEGRP